MKVKIDKIIICILIFFILLFAGCKDQIIQGRISVRGNESHAYLTIQTPEAVFEITGPLKPEIWDNYQGQNIKVRAKLIREARGPGFPAQIEVLEILR